MKRSLPQPRRHRLSGLIWVVLCFSAPFLGTLEGLAQSGSYTRLDLEFECPASVKLGEPLLIRSVAYNRDREVPVQTSVMLFPDEIRSFGIQASNGDEVHLFHRLLESPNQPRVIPSNYGRYDLPLTIPFAQAVHRPSKPGRPLTMEVLVRPAQAGNFRLYFKTATRSRDRTYDYYPPSGLTGPYDELVEVCRIEVIEEDD